MTDSLSNPSDLLDRVDELTSALLDHAIDEDGIRELGEILADESTARMRYIENMQLHAELIEHYGDKQESVPVLSMLGEDAAGLRGVAPIVTPPAKDC